MLAASKAGSHAEIAGDKGNVVNSQHSDTAADRSVSRFSCWQTFAVRCTVAAAVVVWGVGTLLLVTVQDAVPVLSGVYYALPIPVLAFAGGIACVASLRWAKDCRITAACLLLLEMQLIVWGGQVFHGSGVEPSIDSMRFVFWNVCRGNFGYDAAARELAGSDADIIALVEATEQAEYADFWTSRIPGYSARRLGSGMMILCRGEILAVQPGNVTVSEEPEAVCRYRVISLRVDGIEMRVLLVDVKSDPLMFRKPAFERLAKLAGELSDQPLIVAADFNTPINSVWVDLLRRPLTNSFEAAGDGYRETWPTFFPVLCLDQVWANGQVLWQRSRNGWSLRSDHRSVTAEFSVGQPTSSVKSVSSDAAR